MKRTWLLLTGLLLLAATAGRAQFSYSTNGTTITLTSYSGQGGAVTISNFVTAIAGSAFRNCTNVTSVTIPDSVTSLGDYVFFGCSSLTNATTGNGADSIGNYEFFDCGALVHVTIGNSVSSIGELAFYNCTKLAGVTFPASLQTVGLYAFELCASLNRLTIPGSLNGIGDEAFSGSGLTNLTILSGVTNLEDYAFGGCDELRSVYFQGNAPDTDPTVFPDATNATAYYLPGTTGWSTWGGTLPTVLWNPQIQAPGISNNQFVFNITGTSNIPIVVKACTNPGAAGWISLASVTLTNGTYSFSDPAWTAYSRRFYCISSP